MHDPDILIYNCRLFSLWHHDPESDGTDDSCGWSFPRLAKQQRERIKSLAWSEAYTPTFQRRQEKKNERPAELESLMRGAIVMVCRVLDLSLSWDHTCRLAVELVHGPGDNFRGAFCHQPGYHTNFAKDTRDGRQDTAYGLFSGVAKNVLRELRPWWRHPRWHVWHWRVQIHAFLSLKRWLFSRCAGCGKGFPWGYAPVSGSWDSDGPRWFRGEPGVYHHGCQRVGVPTAGFEESPS